ncbi:MAG: DUF4293 domain-containing protein [Sphingobacteriaceae bacterium]
MLQRIQTIWLFFTSAALFSLFLFPTMQWINPDGKAQVAKISGVYESINGQVVQITPFTLLTIACVVLALVPFVVIFFYQNRALQIKLCYAAIAGILAYSFWLAQSIKKVAAISRFNTENYGIGAILPSLAILFIILAIRSIRKDENLIRSADRLR